MDTPLYFYAHQRWEKPTNAGSLQYTDQQPRGLETQVTNLDRKDWHSTIRDMTLLSLIEVNGWNVERKTRGSGLRAVQKSARIFVNNSWRASSRSIARQHYTAGKLAIQVLGIEYGCTHDIDIGRNDRILTIDLELPKPKSIRQGGHAGRRSVVVIMFNIPFHW